MHITTHQSRQRAHLRPIKGVFGQQGGRRVGLFQPLNDGGRLNQHLAIIERQCGHHLLRIDRLVRGQQVLFGAQIHGHILRCQALEVECNTQAVRGATAEKVVELHGAMILFSSGNVQAHFAHTFDPPGDAVTRDHRPHAFRCAGVDQVTRLQVIKE